MSEESRLYVGFVQEKLPSVLKEEKNIHVRDVGNRLRILDRVFFVHGFSKRSMLT